jgi:hypothetical protein
MPCTVRYTRTSSRHGQTTTWLLHCMSSPTSTCRPATTCSRRHRPRARWPTSRTRRSSTSSTRRHATCCRRWLRRSCAWHAVAGRAAFAHADFPHACRHQRNWRFHRELQLWLTQHGEPSQKTPTYERGTYLFFDPRAWEKVSKGMSRRRLRCTSARGLTAPRRVCADV